MNCFKHLVINLIEDRLYWRGRGRGVPRAEWIVSCEWQCVCCGQLEWMVDTLSQLAPNPPTATTQMTV